ncbi:MAG: anti-sigma factor family protein [Thermoanaerobaculia bacterium]
MSARPHITCRELIEFIADYLEGALDEIQAEDFARHLAICVSCRAYLASYATTIRAGKAVLRYDDTPANAPEDLVRAILMTRRG